MGGLTVGDVVAYLEIGYFAAEVAGISKREDQSAHLGHLVFAAVVAHPTFVHIVDEASVDIEGYRAVCALDSHMVTFVRKNVEAETVEVALTAVAHVPVMGSLSHRVASGVWKRTVPLFSAAPSMSNSTV